VHVQFDPVRAEISRGNERHDGVLPGRMAGSSVGENLGHSVFLTARGSAAAWPRLRLAIRSAIVLVITCLHDPAPSLRIEDRSSGIDRLFAGQQVAVSVDCSIQVL
jgi:hypothetical protein